MFKKFFCIVKEGLILKILLFNSKCVYCNKPVKLYWQTSYHGFRGRCTGCKANWPES